MALTRRDIADDFDAVDEQIAELNSHKSDVLNDYRAQLAAEGMTKPQIKLEVEATKAAIKRLRAKAKDATLVEEKDALVDEIEDEITRSRARRTTRVENIEEFPAHDADGVILEDEPQGHDGSASPAQMPSVEAADLPADDGIATSLTGAEGIEDLSTITEPQHAPHAGSDLTIPPGPQGQVADIPETVIPVSSDVGEAQKVERQSPKLEDAGSIPAADANAGSSNGRTAPFDGVNAGSTPAPATISFADKIKKLRPLCQQPESCRSSGGKAHCYLCMKANAQAVSA